MTTARTKLSALALFALGALLCVPVDGCGAGAPRASRPPRAAPGPPDPIEAWTSPGPACHSDSDCKQNEQCFPPGFEPAPGVAPMPPRPCSQDGDCDSTERCDGQACVRRCTGDAWCGANNTCQSGACVPTPCSGPGAAPCATNFSCGAANTCERMSCAADDECEKGACFAGRCYAKAGGCADRGYCCQP